MIQVELEFGLRSHGFVEVIVKAYINFFFGFSFKLWKLMLYANLSNNDITTML